MILVTGGTGRLATELKKHLDGEYVGIEHWDFTFPVPKKDYELIVHMGAYTDVKRAESEPEKCFQTNVFGTFNLSHAFQDVPMVYISTEYAKNPLGIYAKTKLWAEEIVKEHKKHLIIRTSFKPNPFPFPMAYMDQYTQGDYVDVIAKLLADKIKTWDRVTNEFCYVGTGRKTMFELAKRTRPDVLPNFVSDYTGKVGNIIPYDYT